MAGRLLARAGLAAAVIAVAGLGAVGCSHSTAPPQAASPTGSPAATASGAPTSEPTGSPSGPTETSPSASPAPPSSHSPTPGTGTNTPCPGSALTLTVHDLGGAGGSTYTLLLLRNSSTATCTLAGYPTVTLLDAGKTAIGRSVERRSDSEPAVRLRPAGVANALLTTEALSCSNADRVSYLRLLPPHGSTGFVEPVRLLVCKANVSAIHPGQTSPFIH